MRELKLMDLDPASLKDPVAVMGLPGIANVGRIAVGALIQALEAPPLLEFYCEDFPPRVFVRDGIAEFPKSSIHFYRSAPDEPHDLFLLTADYQPTSNKGVYDYADYVAGFFDNMHVKQILALAAYEQNYAEFFKVYPAPPRIFVSASTQELLDRIRLLEGVVPTKEGVISGANGFVPSWASQYYGIESACFLGETMGVIKADYRASREIITRIGEFLELKGDFGILDERAEQVADFIEWAMRELQSKTETEDDSSPSDQYIG